MTLTQGPALSLGVAPVGEPTLLAAKVIAAHIEGFLELPCAILPGLPSPEFALDPGRLQYDAGRIIEGYEGWDLGECHKLVCVLSVDLFVPIFSHVFGEARLGGRVALVSQHRLGQTADGRPLRPEQVLLRTAKVALHELGHLFSLTHCSDPGCLMHFAGDCSDLDRVPLLFCRYCRQFLADARRLPQAGGAERV
jgi:archaemetzincin